MGVSASVSALTCEEAELLYHTEVMVKPDSPILDRELKGTLDFHSLQQSPQPPAEPPAPPEEPPALPVGPSEKPPGPPAEPPAPPELPKNYDARIEAIHRRLQVLQDTLDKIKGNLNRVGQQRCQPPAGVWSTDGPPGLMDNQFAPQGRRRSHRRRRSQRNSHYERELSIDGLHIRVFRNVHMQCTTISPAPFYHPALY
uniref:Uncharacterized protein n=1 Tax=Lygus hesperus TaxID=30085 RepID=A0A146LCU3_LYGHE